MAKFSAKQLIFFNKKKIFCQNLQISEKYAKNYATFMQVMSSIDYYYIYYWK